MKRQEIQLSVPRNLFFFLLILREIDSLPFPFSPRSEIFFFSFTLIVGMGK